MDAQAATGGAPRFVQRVVGAGPYLNLFVNRALVFHLAVQLVQAKGSKYGHGTVHAGKRVIIEHTSSNPNAPLHIGNLRNVMVGAHMAKMLEAVGYDVKQHFYVNDLGAQIGLTALAYSRVYPNLKPSQIKRDHWIGQMYAIMNTLVELQKVSEPWHGAPRTSGNRAIFLLPSPPPPPQPPHVFLTLSTSLS